MDKHPDIEQLESTSLLIKDALNKYLESISLLEESFETALSVKIDPSLSEFQKTAANNHRKKLIRQVSLLLEIIESDDIEEKFENVKSEIQDILTFMHPLRVAS